MANRKGGQILMDAFSERLQRLRIEREMNQADVAPLVRTSRSSYSMYENGHTPPIDVLMACAAFFDVSTDYLLGLTSERKPAGDAISSTLEQLAPLAAAAGTMSAYKTFRIRGRAHNG